MSFGKKRTKLPDSVADLDWEDLHNSQMWIMAEWLGCKNLVLSAPAEERRTTLKKHAGASPPGRVEEGYAVICLGKSGAPKAPKAVEERALELCTAAFDGFKTQLRERVVEFKEQSKEALTTIEEHVKTTMMGMAKQVLKEAAENARPIVIQEGTAKRKVKGVVPPEFERMVQLASARIPIMLVGPAGCGKTHLCEKLSEALGMEFSDQSCSEGMSESVFNGFLLPIGKAGAFDHVRSPFMDRYENGGIMLLDEIDAGDPNLYTYINKAIANQSYTVAQRFTKPCVKKHRDFVLVCAANTFGHGADSMYVGRNQLDAATLDRFKVGMITMGYSKEVETSISQNDKLCEWAWKIRAKIQEQKLRRVMSTRTIKDLAEMSRRYDWKQSEWEAAYFTGWSENEKAQVVEKPSDSVTRDNYIEKQMEAAKRFKESYSGDNHRKARFT